MCIQLSDFKYANLFDIVKYYFIPANEASFGNDFSWNISNFYGEVPQPKQILKSFNQSKIENVEISKKGGIWYFW